MYGSSSSLACYLLSPPLTCFRQPQPPATSGSLWVPLKTLSSDLRGGHSSSHGPLGSGQQESREAVRGWHVGDTNPPLDLANLQKWLQLLGRFSDLLMACCWTFLTTVLLIWQGSPSAGHHKYPSEFSGLPSTSVGWDPPYIWQILFWAESF